MFSTGFATNALDVTFDYCVFQFGPSRQRQDFRPTHQYRNIAEMTADYNLRGTITVNTDYSENTVFGEARINHCFRFWHDLCHIATGAPFDADGERAAALYQIAQINALVGPSDADKARWAAIVDCEVNGQVEYYLQHGEFPANQREFAIAYLTSKGWDVATFPKTLSGGTAFIESLAPVAPTPYSVPAIAIADTPATYDHVGAIIEFECGELDADSVIELFQHLVNTGIVDSLQGGYGRMAARLIAAGHITRP